jgi:hypothetical protein
MFITRMETIFRGAVGWGAVGFAWPASFLVAAVIAGEGLSRNLSGEIAYLALSAAIGAGAGALAAGAASLVSLTRAIERPSPPPPPR